MKQLASEILIDLLVLLLYGRLSGGRGKPWNVLLAAFAGGGISLAARQLQLSDGQALLLALPTALLMAAIMQGRRALFHPARSILTILAAAGLLGGTVLALSRAAGSLAAGWMLGGAAAAGMLASVCRGVIERMQPRALSVTIGVQGREAGFSAIADSGNTLRDYLTGLPVIVLPMGAMKALGMTERQTGIRPIFADTAGGRQMMLLLIPQTCRIQTEDMTREVRAAAAFSQGLAEDAPALIPTSLLKG